MVAQLYDEFSSVERILTTAKVDSFYQSENVSRELQVKFPLNVMRERDLVNKRSNCWLSSVLHCLSSTPLLNFLNKLRSTSDPSSLLSLLSKCLKNLQIIPDKKTSPVRLCEGPLDLAHAIGMIPDVREHKDASEFLTKILEGLTYEIFESELAELNELFQWKIFCLNRCLVPECKKVSGRSVVMWSRPIQIPKTGNTINLQSLLWCHSTGRFTTEDDEVCKTCHCKPAAHHVELIQEIPSVLTFTINRVKFTDTLRRIDTPILCDTTINLRGMTAQNFDETDLKCTLLAAILHKGPFIQRGHFIAYVFNTANTAILYDDTIVKEVCSKNILTSPEFMKNVYMCFYSKGVCVHDRKREYTDTPIDVITPGCCSEWKLSSSDFALVDKAWSYKKKMTLGTVSSFDLKTLKPSNWLNDNVVNAFFSTILAESSSNSNIRVHTFSSYLYTVLRDGSWKSSVLRVSLSVNPLDFDLLPFPIHFNKHWQLIACYPNSSLLVFFDSLLTVNYTALGLTLGFLEALFSAIIVKCKLEEWMILAPDTIPRQQDSSSCGSFARMNAYSLVSGNIDFYKSEDMDNIRRWIVFRLITTSLPQKYFTRQQPRIESCSSNNITINEKDVKRSVPGCEPSYQRSVFNAIKRLADQRKSSNINEMNTSPITPATSFHVSLHPGK